MAGLLLEGIGFGLVGPGPVCGNVDRAEWVVDRRGMSFWSGWMACCGRGGWMGWWWQFENEDKIRMGDAGENERQIGEQW